MVQKSHLWDASGLWEPVVLRPGDHADAIVGTGAPPAQMGLTPTADAVWGMRDRLEEPDVRPTSPVLWELGAGNRPWLPDPLSLSRRSHLHLPNRASLVLGPFAETKGPRLPGRNPAISKTDWTLYLVQYVRLVPTVV